MDKKVKEINGDFINSKVKLSVDKRKMVEYDGAPLVWGLVNTEKDEISKSFSGYSPDQLNWFKKAIEVCINNDTTGSFAYSEGISFLPNKKWASKEYGCFVDSLCNNQWLYPISKKEHYTLGPRTMLELSGHLQGLDVYECERLKKPVIRTAEYQHWKAQRSSTAIKSGQSSSSKRVKKDQIISDDDTQSDDD